MGVVVVWNQTTFATPRPIQTPEGMGHFHLHFYTIIRSIFDFIFANMRYSQSVHLKKENSENFQ